MFGSSLRRLGLMSCLCAVAMAPAAGATTNSSPLYTVKVYDRSAASTSFIGGDLSSYYGAFSDGSGWSYSTPGQGSLQLSSTGFLFQPSWPSRSLTLTLVDSRGVFIKDAAGTPANNYQCQGGALNVADSYVGAPSAGGWMQCYNAAKTLGFYVKWPPFSKADGGGGTACLQLSTGSLSGSKVIDSGTTCMAHVSLKHNGTTTLITEPGTSTPECFMISFRLEADPA